MPSIPARRLLIVEDDPALGPAMLRALRSTPRTLAATISQARAALAEGDVFAIVLDVRLGLESGLDWLSELRAQGSQIPVLVLTGSDANDLPNRANLLGAEFVRKEDGFITNVVGFIERATHGRALQTKNSVAAFAHAWGLTKAHEVVLLASMQTSTHKETAHVLGLSPRTVEKHFQEIKRRTGAAGRRTILVSVLEGQLPDVR